MKTRSSLRATRGEPGRQMLFSLCATFKSQEAATDKGRENTWRNGVIDEPRFFSDVRKHVCVRFKRERMSRHCVHNDKHMTEGSAL